jgi:hypothetical protein
MLPRHIKASISAPLTERLDRNTSPHPICDPEREMIEKPKEIKLRDTA